MGSQKAGAGRDGVFSMWTGQVVDEWVDYNGHMTEHRYLQVFGESTDQLLAHIGVDFARAEEGAYYTLETHIRHLRECRAGAFLRTSTEILGYDEKWLHLYHRMLDATDQLLATGEHLCIHVANSKACNADSQVVQRIAAIFETQKDFPRPERTGSVLTRTLLYSRL